MSCFAVAALANLTTWYLLFYVVLIQALTSLFVFLRSIVTAHQYFTVDAFFSVIDKLLMIVICGMMIYSTFFVRINLLRFLQVQSICTGMAVIIAVVFILNKGWLTSGQNETVASVFHHTWPFAACILLMSVHYRLDGFLLERIHRNGSMEAGRYAAAYRLLDAANMVGYLAASFLVPFVARHLSEKQMVHETLLRARHALILFAVGVVSFAIVFAPWMQQLLYHTNEFYLSQVMAWCLASLPGYYLVHVYGSLLTASGNLMTFMKILVVCVMINVTLNVVLIPSYGALGCCIAAVVSQYVCGMATCYTATRKEGISADIRYFLGYILIGILLFLFFYGGKMVISNVWIILAIAVILCLLLLATRLGFFKKKFILLR
jgi:O-antigen/teichoic acid export membrane protein